MLRQSALKMDRQLRGFGQVLLPLRPWWHTAPRNASLLFARGVCTAADPRWGWPAGLRDEDVHLRLQRGSSTLPIAFPRSTSSSSSSRVAHEVEEYWREILQSVDKPTAKRLLKFVDPSVPLGLPNLVTPSVTIREGDSPIASKPARPPVFSYFLQTKLEHPTKVLLVRVGEFYETIGIDAILLVQHAGLNPMGREGNPPRAGCPRANLRRTVADLVEGAGLSVVVCEEAPEPYNYGALRRQQKQRYVAAVVTPAAPHFLHGLVDEDTDVVLDSAPPLLGIAPRVGGYSVIEVDVELLTVRLIEGLTEDAVYARLHEGGVAPPLYVHVPPASAATDRRLTESISEGEWERRIGAVFRTHVGAVQRYSDPDPVTGMLDRIKRQLGLKQDVEFRELPTASSRTRPRPLYYSTASNLGLHKTRGVPSLLDYSLPQGAPLTSRRWLKKLLLLPPSPSVGLAIHEACKALLTIDAPVPAFPVMAPANVVLKLRAEEANDTFFRELGELCRAVETACMRPELAGMADAVLVATAAETGVVVDRAALARGCGDVLRAVHDVIDHDMDVGRSVMGTISSDAGEGAEEEREIEGGTPPVVVTGEGVPYGGPLARFFTSNEDFRGKIRPEKLRSVYAAVTSAGQRVVDTAERAVSLATAAFPPPAQPSSSKAAQAKPTLFYDVNNNAAWIKLPKGASAKEATAAGLVHPKDRNGRVESSVYSTIDLEGAQDAYRRACADARDAVRAELRALSRSLQPSTPALVAAATFAVVASALDAHVREASRRKWALPQLRYDAPGCLITKDDGTNGDSKEQDSQGSLHVVEMWPYWLGGPGGIDPDVVTNTFDMDGMFLLTGPNMAGKSTVLRSTCAVALLGACGLAVPAAPATRIPYIDAFMLRNFSADSPLEGRSSFAVEMTEMRYVLADATPQSLVLVDELGKGTEARAGSALAGAMLEALDATGCRGVFATHLHSLLDMDLALKRTERMMMQVREEEGRVEEGDQKAERETISLRRRRMVPTWRIVPGSSVESLALDVAAACRLPENVVARAEQLYNDVRRPETGRHSVVDELNNEKMASNSSNFEETSISAHHDEQERQSKPQWSRELSKAAVVLEDTTRSVLCSLTHPETSSDEGLQERDEALQDVTVRFVPRGSTPPAGIMGLSCVYIARSGEGWFYVGSTDSLFDRIRTHRQPGSGSKVADPAAEFVYVALEGAGSGSSVAKTVEREVIRAMQRGGYGLLSDADARKRYAPIAAYLDRRGSRYGPRL